MSDVWRSLTIFLPANLSRDEVSAEIRASVVRFAADGGEFVHGIRVEGHVAHADGWLKWRTSFQPGPPGLRYCSGMAID